MKIEKILAPKSFSAIRHDVPSRYRFAMIENSVFDLQSEEKYQLFENNGNVITDEALFNMIVNSYRNSDNILTESEIFYGTFHFRDYIVLNELLAPTQKWDLCFCNSIFNGEIDRFEIQCINITTKEYYRLSTCDLTYKERLLYAISGLELVKLHIVFDSLNGKHEIPSRFIDLVQRAGWENGVKMIKALLSVLEKMQMSGKLSKKNIMTRMSDRLQSDDHDIIYRFSTGKKGYHFITRHLIEENTTSVSIFKNGTDEYTEEVFEW